MGVLALACLMALLAIPVEIAFDIKKEEKFQSIVSIGWLFGLVRAPLSSKSSKSAAKKPKKKKEKKKKPGREWKALSIARDRRFRLRVMRFIKDILGAIQTSGLFFRARLGLGDPAETGMLWGFIGPLAAMLSGVRKAVIRIEPEFIQEILEVHCKGQVKVIPLQILFITALFLISPITIRMLWEVW